MRDNGAIEGGAAAFAEDDEVVILRKFDDSKIYVVAHKDGIKSCGFRLKLTRADGVVVTPTSVAYVYIDVYNSEKTFLFRKDIDNCTFDENTSEWVFSIPKAQSDPNGYYLKYTCTKGWTTHYPYKYKTADFYSTLLKPGHYEDQVHLFWIDMNDTFVPPVVNFDFDFSGGGWVNELLMEALKTYVHTWNNGWSDYPDGPIGFLPEGLVKGRQFGTMRMQCVVYSSMEYNVTDLAYTGGGVVSELQLSDDYTVEEDSREYVATASITFSDGYSLDGVFYESAGAPYFDGIGYMSDVKHSYALQTPAISGRELWVESEFYCTDVIIHGVAGIQVSETEWTGVVYEWHETPIGIQYGDILFHPSLAVQPKLD